MRFFFIYSNLKTETSTDLILSMEKSKLIFYLIKLIYKQNLNNNKCKQMNFKNIKRKKKQMIN